MKRPVQERGRGRASQLGDEYGISPSWLQKLKVRAQLAIAAVKQPGQAGGWSETKALVIERNYLEKSSHIDAAVDWVGGQYPDQTGTADWGQAYAELHQPDPASCMSGSRGILMKDCEYRWRC